MPKKSAPVPSALPTLRPLRGTVIVTRQAHFNAAHRLHNPTKSAQWNTDQYGPCNNPRWHGHNYLLEVSLRGQPDPATGYVIDLSDLNTLIQKHILDHCDHRNLNEEVEFLQGVIPSTENLTIAFWHQLAPHITCGTLHCVKLYETPRNFAEFYGPEAG